MVAKYEANIRVRGNHLLADTDGIPAFAQSPADGVHRPDDSQQSRSGKKGTTKATAESTS